MKILKEIAGITLGTVAVITALLWILILSGYFDIETLLAKSTAAPGKPRIVATGTDTVSGFGFMERRKERGR